jgi:DNA-directed RNA polymerase specialized sigma24 family protein
VGSILGIGQSAVKMRLSRGREMVKKQMEEEA